MYTRRDDGKNKEKKKKESVDRAMMNGVKKPYRPSYIVVVSRDIYIYIILLFIYIPTSMYRYILLYFRVPGQA